MAAPSTITSRSQQIRSGLGHPVIDGDGHVVDLMPVLLDFLGEVAGPAMVDRFRNHDVYKVVVEYSMVRSRLAERRDSWQVYDAWWASTGSTLDRATSMLPGLFEDRLGELGIDFAILFPSETGIVHMLADDELRQAGCRAHNLMVAELFRAHAHALTPVAIIPARTPAEAIAELDFVVQELGLKTVNIGGALPRPIPSLQEQWPDAAGHLTRPELFGIDSDHDYDQVWARCRDLGVAPCFHGKERRRSISSYVYNHIGAFAASSEAMCKALFLGGVTRRFPDVNFGFMEGGVAWACSLYADLISHWEKRGGHAIESLDPARLDVEEILRLVDEYGEDRQHRRRDEIETYYRNPPPRPEQLDEFAACEIERAEDFYELFVPRFFFGCEADSPLNAWGFNRQVNPFGASLQAMLGSDIGHWDVPDSREVVEEAYELVEDGLMTEVDFRAFTFENTVRFHGGMNPSFFDGTNVEAEARAVLAAPPAQA
jgi:predicted TIM-barrel fold metal-dependent hydrolase